MTADEIRRCVTIANGLKADLVALTGDYVADDPAAQGEVVQALAGARRRSQAFVRPMVFSAAWATMRSILKLRIPSHDSLPRWGFASSVKSGHLFNRTAKC